MKTEHSVNGRISDCFKGVGTVTKDMVIQRARENAIINGRQPNRYTQDDFLQAKRELMGLDGFAMDQSEEEPIVGLTSWDEEPGTSGHAMERMTASDEQTLAQQLVEEGVSEAEHEQMVEGAKSPENQE